MIASAEPRWRISQRGSPGSECSATARRRGAELAARAAGAELEPEALQLAAAARAPNAPRPRKARRLVSPGPLASPIMADRMHPQCRNRKPGPVAVRPPGTAEIALPCANAIVADREGRR